MGTTLRPDTNKLIESHRSYAHAIAAEVLRKLPPELDKGDVRGAAELGLVEAAQVFDPSRGVLFKTFAYYRIRGAVYDGLRKMGWFSKSQYQAMRFERAANEYLKDRAADPAAAGSPDDQYADLKDVTGSILSCYLLSLEGLAQEPAERADRSPEESTRKGEERDRVRRALDRLPEKNRQVLEGYYFKESSLEQIGESLGLSKSWVSRIHAKSLEMIREFLEEKAPRRPAPPIATLSRAVR